MTASEAAKYFGCKSLAQIARQTKQSAQTLTNWHKHKPELFIAVCVGVAALNGQTTTAEKVC